MGFINPKSPQSTRSVVSVLLNLCLSAILLWKKSQAISLGPMAEDYDSLEGALNDYYDSILRDKRTGMIDVPIDPLKITDLGKGFLLYHKRLDWKTAHQICEENVGHLATFINKDDAEHVVNKIFELSVFNEKYDWGKEQAELGLDRRYWIGLSDLFKEGEWVWVGKGTPLTYTSMWYPGQPDHVFPNGTIRSGRHQHCGSLWNPAYWKVGKDGAKSEKHSFDDLECDRQLYFICEKDQVKLDAVIAAKTNG